MSTRTDITQKNECFVAEPKDEQFLFEMDPSKPGRTMIIIPRGSKWRPKPHWHERYDEFFAVKKGRALYKIDGLEKVMTPQDGIQSVKVGQVHDFMRADMGIQGEGSDQEDVVIEEWTDPEDGLKQVFFRNLLGVIEDSETYWKKYTPIQALLVMSRYDNYAQIVPGVLSKFATHAAFAVARALAPLLNLQPWYPEYTPESLRKVAQSGGIKSEGKNPLIEHAK
jgi:mannose-6-phosphate isomerase-like protein (cupin superfamily)